MDKRYIFAIAAFLLGSLGIQEFLLGNTARGILGIIFCWTCIPAIVAIVQIVKALCAGSDEQFFEMYPKCRL
ncbi:MAG: NINE protein [Bacteroidales bacterium]|nr:NINE protein [Candidatus Colimorpha onthohippi]